MPFCPSCKYEYHEGVDTCPDCGDKLVPFLPVDEVADINDGSELERDHKDWVHLLNLTSLQIAEMCLDGLRQKNIPAVLHSGTGHFGVTGQMGVSSFRPIDGNYKIYVPREFLSDAVEEAKIIIGEDWDKFKAVD
ncbi:MAG: hypothetical protein KAR42_05735 [candidate division Zixibacteria bacterium]|nr:hypothetical protein [candidate division Zixibacteria bacterium]